MHFSLVGILFLLYCCYYYP